MISYGDINNNNPNNINPNNIESVTMLKDAEDGKTPLNLNFNRSVKEKPDLSPLAIVGKQDYVDQEEMLS